MRLGAVQCLCSLILCSVLASVNSDDDDEVCTTGWKCLPLSSCSLDSDDFETIFPCNQFGKPIKVCCPPLRDATRPAPVKSGSTAATTPITTSTTTSTAASVSTKKGSVITTLKINMNFTTPKPSTKNSSSLWDNIPESLQDRLSLLPDPEDCGRVWSPDRIINGQNAEMAEYPWMALVGYEENGMNRFYCGGSLISKRYVLTAAHCSRAGTFLPSVVRFGEWNLTSEGDCQLVQVNVTACADKEVDVGIEEFIVHESYGNKSLPLLRFDIALIRLADDLNFTDYIQPICLSPKPYNSKTEKYTVSGWGVTDNLSRMPSPILQYIEVLLYDFNECNAIAPAEVSPLLRKTQFCAGGSNGQDACKGDSGGPLTYFKDNREYLKGIVSLATSLVCGREGRPTVYTEVSTFMKWILRHMHE